MFLFAQGGCAHTGPILSETNQEDARRIGVVVKGGQAESFQDSRRGWLSSMGKGAARGSVLGGAGFLCYWGAIVCVPVLAAAGAVGGSVYGLYQASSEIIPTEVETMLGQAINDAGLANLLVEDLVAIAQASGYAMEASKHAPLATGKNHEKELLGLPEPFDILLEVEGPVVNLLPATFAVDPPRRVGLSTRVRVIQTTNRNVLDDRVILEELGDVHPMEEWTADQAKHFREELPRATRRLSQKILIDYFMRYAFKERTFPSGAGWFIDLYVQTRVKGLWPFPHLGGWDEPGVYRPTLRWETFSGEHVTYDLRIWESKVASTTQVGEVVYSREGLLGNVHRLETTLSRSTTYTWSVRARFIKNGKARVTEWSKAKSGFTLWGKIGSFGVLAIAELAIGEDWGFYQIRTP